MKKLLLSILLVSGCSGIEVFSINHYVDLTKDDLKLKSKEFYKKSGVGSYTPAASERNDYYSGLESNQDYRSYLFLECAMLLHKENNLDFQKAVNASIPRWNNISNWYSSIFNFHSTEKKNDSIETMECDLAVNDKFEVREYQLKKSFIKLIKTE